jgi:hypothetical protein
MRRHDGLVGSNTRSVAPPCQPARATRLGTTATPPLSLSLSDSLTLSLSLSLSLSLFRPYPLQGFIDLCAAARVCVDDVKVGRDVLALHGAKELGIARYVGGENIASVTFVCCCASACGRNNVAVICIRTLVLGLCVLLTSAHARAGGITKAPVHDKKKRRNVCECACARDTYLVQPQHVAFFLLLPHGQALFFEERLDSVCNAIRSGQHAELREGRPTTSSTSSSTSGTSSTSSTSSTSDISGTSGDGVLSWRR